MKFVSCFLLLAAVVHNCAGMSWDICEGAGDLWKPVEVSINPDPAIAGQDISFQIKGEADHTVAGGYLVASVSLAGVPIAEEVKDLCKRTQCPINKGPVDVVYKQVLPPFVPQGSYEVQVQLKDTEDNVLMCIVVDFDINLPAFGKVVSNVMGSWGRST